MVYSLAMTISHLRLDRKTLQSKQLNAYFYIGQSVVLPMSNSNLAERTNEGNNHMVLFIYRVPKKNVDSLVQVGQQANELFRKVGVRTDVFKLCGTEDAIGFTNIAKTIYANEEEEVWAELHTYRDKKHLEEVTEKMKNDKYAMAIGQQTASLITQRSMRIFGSFSRI